MNTEDHIWALVAKKLANEATEEEIKELDKLLMQYGDIDKRVKVIADWWRETDPDETAQRGSLLFGKIKEKINAREKE
jgi:hypothetical protein